MSSSRSLLPDRAPRLKSLEMQGYKSFANKTVFEFAPTVTAVVGPNGSGKSNIADAIRWVLGEQSYSLLRGKKTEDMIFTGSESRARAGMASVTITFDNESGWLPIDFTEVTISRRAHRDGQNEYYLNDQRVRLRDVGELLAASGLAQRTYTVIGQGLVDAVLSLKAEERRKLFEEAAGIELHRFRREEAVRRLDATRRNLERVGDILAEIRPRLRSLERQARRAGEYDQIREDLQEVLRIWYGYHWYQLTGVLQETRQRAEAAARRHDSLQQDQETTEETLERIQVELNGLRAAVQRKSSESSAQLMDKEQVSRRVAVAEARLEWLEVQERMVSRDQANLLKQREELGRRTAGGPAGQLSRGMQATESFDQADPSQKEAEETTNPDARADFLTLRQRLLEIQGSQEALHLRSRVVADRLTALAGQTSSISEQTRAAQTELTDLLQRLEARRADRGIQQRRLEELITRQDQCRTELDLSQKKALESKESIADLQIRKAALQAKLDSTEALGSVSGSALLLEASEQGEIPETMGQLNQHLKIHPEMRLPLQAILGDHGQGLLFRTIAELDAALGWLIEKGGGSAVLLNLLADYSQEPIPVTEEDGVLGIAASFVESSPELRPLLQHLFGRVLLTGTRTDARRIADQLPSGWRVVTKDGVIFYPAGTVIVHSEQSLQEGRDPIVLQKEMAKLEQELDKKLNGLGAHQDKVLQLEPQMQALLQEQDEAVTLLEDGRVSLDALSIEHALLEARIHGFQENGQSLEKQQQSLAKERTDLQNQEAELESRHRELLSRLESLGRFLDLPTMDEVGTGEIDLLGKDPLSQTRFQRQIELADLQLEDVQRKLRETAEDIAGTTAELSSGRESLERLSNRLAKREEEREALEAQIQDLDLQRMEVERKHHEIRAERRVTDQRYTKDQIDLARKQEELASLEIRIRDDFGLVSFEADEHTTVQEPLPLEGWVEHLARVDSIFPDLEGQVNRLRAQIRRMGPVNPEAQREYREVNERTSFLKDQIEDLERAENQLQEVIAELDALMAREFRKTFEAVAEAFQEAFERLFKGGSAQLLLTETDDLSTTGIDIEVRLPGRREQGLAMLSGGERSLTASALIFALLKVSPTPFCVLDEVDAMLDETNILRFGEILRELSLETQFLIITHNRQTIQDAEVIYGVSIGTDSASKIISLKLEEAAREYVEA